MSDNMNYTPEGLAKARGCLGQLNEFVNTSGYGQLSNKSQRFINGNKTWYKDSTSRQSLSDYNNYFSHGYKSNGNGRQKDLEDCSDDALIMFDRTLVAIGQFDDNVRTYFQEHPVEHATVSKGFLWAANFWDAAVVDPINGILGWENLVQNGEDQNPYEARLATSITTDTPGSPIDQTIATTGYAAGTIITEKILNAIPIFGPILSAIHSTTQATGVGISHSLQDDGEVTQSEHAGSLATGAVLGPFFWFTGNSAGTGSVVNEATGFFAGMWGAETEEVINEAIVGEGLPTREQNREEKWANIG